MAFLLAFVLLAGSFLITSAVNRSEKSKEDNSPSMLESLGSYLAGDSFNINLPDEDFIAYLDVSGTISENETYSSSYSHSFNLNYIDALVESRYNIGLIMYMNSSGGSVYASDELYLAIEYYKEATGRPVFCYFGPTACSGAYYIAMAADEIYANRNTMTGSIGVIMQMYDLTGLYDKLGVKEVDIVSGKNKAMGSQGLELTKEQRGILQSLVDEAYDQFVGIVADGRKMDKSAVKKIADGRIYSAKQAKEINLVDEVGSLKDEKKAFAKEVGFSEDITYYTPEKDSLSGMFSSIFGAVKDIVPKSDIDLAEDIVQNNGNGVLKYYAK